ncbi:MAG: hypothetical protein ACLQDL_14215 [Spirochaetia bacterium]
MTPTGDDVGTQDRMLISLELFWEFLKPRGKLFGEHKQANPSRKISAHICGYIEPVIDPMSSPLPSCAR